MLHTKRDPSSLGMTAQSNGANTHPYKPRVGQLHDVGCGEANAADEERSLDAHRAEREAARDDNFKQRQNPKNARLEPSSQKTRASREARSMGTHRRGGAARRMLDNVKERWRRRGLEAGGGLEQSKLTTGGHDILAA